MTLIDGADGETSREQQTDGDDHAVVGLMTAMGSPPAQSQQK
jgi:hypothetical protein